jgi:PAS domain S-box-containing protein
MTTTSDQRAADLHLALALEAGDIGAWEWNIKTGRVTWSTTLERIHGLEEGTFAGTFEAYQQDIHPEDRDHVFATVQRSLEARQPHHLEYRIIRPDGEVRVLQARGRLLLDDSGQPDRLLGVCMDVTEQREINRLREHAEAQAAGRERLALLSRDIGLALTAPGELKNTLQRCSQVVVDHLGAAFARIWTLNEGEQTLELQASAGIYTHLDGPHGRVPVGKFKIGLIAAEREPHLTNQVVGDPRVGDQDWARREGMVAFAGYPLLINNALVGVLAMFSRQALSDEDFQALGTVANAIAVGIARARADAEIRQRAAELAYQRDLTLTIANNTASALFMMDRNGFPVFMNTAACEMTGYSGIDEIKSRPLHYAVHFRKPDGSPYPMEECPIDRANAEIVAVRAQRETFCRKDGSLFPVEYNVAPIARAGDTEGAVIEVRDITAELASQQALRDSDERFHLLARATNDTIWDWNLVTGAVWWNDNFAAMFGYAMTDLEPGPESWTSRIHPDDQARVADGIHHAIDGTASTWSDEYRFRRHDGSYADIFDRGILVRDADGRAVRMIGSMMDVSARKRAELALRLHADEMAALARALQRSNQELDQFAYVASHDLKAPLRGIANLSQWIEEDLAKALTDTTRDHLKLLRTRVHRMEALIEGVLEYSRAGRTQGEIEAVAVHRLVTDVVELLTAPAHVRISIEGKLPVLTTQKLPLQQVFMNLIGNAVKHAGGGPDAQITVAASTVDGVPSFTVRDNGPGIAEAFHDKVWGIFQTLQPRDKVEGTGIGLALVKKIVELRGGRVWLESSEGAGATFGFTWPPEHKEPDA